MAKYHLYIVLSFLFIMTLILSNVRSDSLINLTGDLGQNLSILYNTYNNFIPYNDFLPSLLQHTKIDFIHVRTVEFLCNFEFQNTELKDKNLNHLTFHSYFIVYLIAPFVKIFGDYRFTLEFFNLLSFFGILYLFYAYLSNNNMKIFLCFLACLVITTNPAWSVSILGTFYYDRLYLLFGFLLILATTAKKFNPIFFLAALVLSGSVVEKVLIYNSIFLFLYLFFYFFEIEKIKKYYIISAIFIQILLFASIAFFWMSEAGSYTDYESNIIPQNIINHINNPLMLGKSIYFISFAIPLLLPSLIFAPRIFLISFIMLLPNVFGNLGGAEKVNFATHYHTLYFPFIVFAFALGVIQFNKFLISKKISQKLISIIFFSYFILSILFYSSVKFDHANNETYFKFESMGYYSNQIEKRFFKDQFKNNGEYQRLISIIHKEVPMNSFVLVNETSMPFMVGYENVSYFPYNYENADFLVTSYIENNNSKKIPYLMNLSDLHDTKKNYQNNIEAGNCIVSELEDIGFDFNNPLEINPFFMIVGKSN